MRYYLYSSTGNTLGVQSYLAYFEISDDGYCQRYIELNANGVALRYTVEHAADEHGQLPEGNWSANEPEMSKKEYGVVAPITVELFNTIWVTTKAINDATATK